MIIHGMENTPQNTATFLKIPTQMELMIIPAIMTTKEITPIAPVTEKRILVGADSFTIIFRKSPTTQKQDMYNAYINPTRNGAHFIMQEAANST